MKFLKWVGIGLTILVIGIQFFRPERTNPPVDQTRTMYSMFSVPDDIKGIVDRSCSDCHSYDTRWPWYSSIAPVSWLVANDVKEGRKHLNLSDFAQYGSRRALGKLDMMCENMQDGLMPLPQYLTLHPNARLSAEEIDRFCTWVDSLHASIAPEAQ